ncbi:MAG: anti-anti-sigma regulatory factor [Candidatus Azotimanducaceae bacterium]|jgi:anti-anti-sigma regulatory factor
MGKILFAEHDGVYLLKFIGDVRLTLGPTISTFLEQIKSCVGFKAMVVDLSDTETIDSTALGLIAKIAICTRESYESSTSVVSPKDDITRILQSMSMQEVCTLTEAPYAAGDFNELPREIASEDMLRDHVLEAHRTLMSFDESNRDKFRDLVEALESEKHAPEPIAVNCS